jgi:hypothetical protein
VGVNHIKRALGGCFPGKFAIAVDLAKEIVGSDFGRRRGRGLR